jgi:MacB-like periplasmic core domain
MLVQDMQFAVRVLRKPPGFTAVAVLTVSLGIGATTGGFSLLNALLYREPPVPHAELRVVYHRLIGPADANPSAPISRVAVISYGYWQSRLAGNPAALGTQILGENQPFTVVGVTSRRFLGLTESTPPDVSIPITAFSVVTPGVPFQITGAHYLWLNILGRPKSGVSVPQARAQLAGIWPISTDYRTSDGPVLPW